MTTLDREALAQFQATLAAQVMIPGPDHVQAWAQDTVFLALDIQYRGDTAHIAGDLSTLDGEMLGTYAGQLQVEIPYVSSYFCFREGPPLLAFLQQIQRTTLPQPTFLLLDGHGIAHPRRFGVACWMGIVTKMPTIGCAKDTLVRYQGELGTEKGSTIEITVDDQVVGHVLRRIEHVKPVFSSPGHLCSAAEATRVVRDLPSQFRIPDPIRRADRAAREHSRQESSGQWTDIGQLSLDLPDWAMPPALRH